MNPPYRTVATALSILMMVFSPLTSAESPTETVVFQSGTEGYHTFRIPVLATTSTGRVLAFAEGRKDGQGDSGQIDLVMRHSDNAGAAWSALRVVASDPGFTTGNPTPIVNRNTGTVWLLLTRNEASANEPAILAGTAPRRTVWLTHSEDEGLTWAAPVDLTESLSRPEWRWYATGPCHGIQLRDGALAAPGNHSLSPDHKDWRTHLLLSEDGGKTWRLGGVHEGFTNESTIAELDDGRLYQNMRNYKGTHRRAVSYSKDRGATWTPATDDPALIEPVCQASVLSVPAPGGKAAHALLFSNPASEKRERMTVRASLDGGESWPREQVLYAGPAAYSDLTLLASEDAACLYERGKEHPYEEIVFARFPLAWIF